MDQPYRTLPARWHVGDAVKRPICVYQVGGPVRRGVVTRCYSETGYPELYEVEWRIVAGKRIEPLVRKGYLRHGLDADDQ